MNDSVTDVSVTPVTDRSLTVPSGSGALTASVALPLTLPLVAVIVVEPALIPLATPLSDTGATPVFLDVHVTAWPVRTAPVASLSVVVNAYVPPTVTLAEAGATVTDATVGTLGVIRPVPTVRLSTHIVWSTGDPSPM